MDKYEFNIKVEQIKKLVTKGDFVTSMKIADTIDWHRVRNANLLAMISQVYEKNGEYQEAKEVLLQAYERAPLGKRLLFKLAELALREGSVREAEDYYREFCEIAGGDNRQNLLRYMILKAKGASLEQLISALERYTNTELDEKWMYELAELYSKAGEKVKCINLCDKIMLMFGVGDYVDKAMALKVRYAPLSDYQVDLVENRDQYEARLKAVEEEYSRSPLDRLESEMMMESERIESSYGNEPYGNESYDNDSYQDDYSQNYADYSSVDEDLVANLHEAEAEQKLAQEMSKISEEGYVEPIDHSEPTKRLYQINRAKPEVPVQEEEYYEEENPVEDPKDQLIAGVEAADEDSSDEPEAAEAADEEKVEKSSDSVDKEAEKPEESEKDADSVSPAETSEAVKPTDSVESAASSGNKTSKYIAIEARTPEKSLQTAIEKLKEYHLKNDSHNQTVKISAEKLNNRGILNVADKLAGKNLIIEDAGDLNEEELINLNNLIVEDESGMVVVLLDNPRQMEDMYQKNSEFMKLFKHIDAENPDAEEDIEQAVLKQIEEEEQRALKEEEGPEAIASVSDKEKSAVIEPVEEEEELYDEEEMTPDEFAEYACEYASQIDCSIVGKSKLALYERVEIMEEDGIPLTRANAEGMIEEAADKAEKPSLGRLITGVLSPKYDKEGLLILREKHFI